MEVSEESIAKMFAGPFVTGGFADVSVHVDVVRDQEEERQEFLSLKPMKIVSGTNKVADNVRFPSESPLNRFPAVAFMIKEEGDFMFRINQSEERRKSNDGEAVGRRLQLLGERLRLDFRLIVLLLFSLGEHLWVSSCLVEKNSLAM